MCYIRIISNVFVILCDKLQKVTKAHFGIYLFIIILFLVAKLIVYEIM